MFLVSGASGFIGTYLVEKILSEGREVCILRHNSKMPAEFIKDKRIRIYDVDITNSGEFRKLKNIRPQAIFHLAGYIPRSDDASEFLRSFEVNVKGTYNILEFARINGIDKVIYSSSISIYGDNANPLKRFKEKFRLRPADYYGISKLAGELLCNRYNKKFKMKIVSLRYSFVYGFGQSEDFMFGKFIKRALSNKDIIVYSDGTMERDFVYVKDVVEANILAYTQDRVGSYNIGYGAGIKISALAKEITKIFNSRSKIIFDRSKKENIAYKVLDISKAKKNLGYRPKFSITEGLEDYKRICEIKKSMC